MYESPYFIFVFLILGMVIALVDPRQDQKRRTFVSFVLPIIVATLTMTLLYNHDAYFITSNPLRAGSLYFFFLIMQVMGDSFGSIIRGRDQQNLKPED